MLEGWELALPPNWNAPAGVVDGATVAERELDELKPPKPGVEGVGCC